MLVTFGVGVGSNPAIAVDPTFDTAPPERLYTLDGAAIAFNGVPDPISGDVRTLDIDADVSGCAPAQGNNYAIGGCARVQLSVTTGTLAVVTDPNIPPGTFPWDRRTPGGAIVTDSTSGTGSGLSIGMNGTAAQLDAALETLTWTPDANYVNTDDTPTYLEVEVVDGAVPADNVIINVELRVDQVNDGPDLTVPAAPVAVAAGGEVFVPAVMPGVNDLGELSVTDPDIDDGAEHNMMVVMWATCGQFKVRFASLPISDDLEWVVREGLDLPHPGDPDHDALQGEAVSAVIDLLPSEVTGQAFATSNPDDYNTAIAGIGTLDEINYALSYVGFEAPAGSATCELWTVVTDLGNRGLPFSYVGSPIGGVDDPQPGFEVPLPLVDLDVVTYVVGDGVEVDVPATATVAEGDTVAIPVNVSTADHPGFSVGVAVTGGSAGAGDYVVPPALIDYAAGEAGPLSISLEALADVDVDPGETVELTISLPAPPPGVSLGNDTVTVTITDMPVVQPTPSPTPEATPSPTPQVTPTPSPTPEATPSATPSPTPSPTPEPTPSATPSPTPEPTPSATPSPTPQATPSPTPQATPSPTPQATPSPTPQATPSPTPQVTPTPSPTPSATPSPTPSPTPSVTPDPSPTPAVTPDPDATPTPGPTSTTSTTAPLPPGSTSSTVPPTGGPTTTVPGGVSPGTSTPTTPGGVGGSAAGQRPLARTGADPGGLLALGLALLAAGASIAVAARTPRRREG